MKPTPISIIICTYNRSDILTECLDSLVNQTADSSLYEVVVIDNNSNDSTAVIVKKYADQYTNFRYVKETRQGLSYARNRGYQEAKSDWVSYVDDDAKAHANYVERALWTITHFDFDCFGGMYYPWHKYRKPRWLPDSFGTKPKIQDKVGIMKKGFASGGVIVFKKQVLETMKGFPVNLGMSGKKVAYGEETYLQVKMREQGYVLGFDPELKIDHLVAKYKLNPWWHVKSKYMIGKQLWDTLNLDSSGIGIKYLLKNALRLFWHDTKQYTPLLLKQNYYWQNWILDVLAPFAINMGKIRGVKNKRSIHKATTNAEQK